VQAWCTARVGAGLVAVTPGCWLGSTRENGVRKGLGRLGHGE
jgi:hypothetical protein